jgi:hypothetical protein
VDVEGSLLCDVLADGTVTGQVLIEAVYDTSSGARIGTRTVDPVTGADHLVQGTLQQCPPPEQCSCETVLLCHTPTAGADPVPFLRTLCRTCSGAATVTDTELDGTTPRDTSAGTVGLCGQEATGRQVIERCGCDDADGDGIGDVRYVELWSVDTADPDAAPLLLGTWQDGDFTLPYTPVSPVDCPAAGPEEVAAPPLVLGTVCYDDGTGTIRTAAVVRCAGCDDTSVRYVDIETGAELTAPSIVPCPADPGCASTVTTLRLCDLNPAVTPDSDGKRCAIPFLRHLVHDCTGALVDTRNTTMDGVTEYVPVQVVDCGNGGLPAMVEVPWEVVDIQPDPDSDPGLGLVFSLSPIDDPATVGTVRVTTSSVYNPASCPGVPPDYQYRNPTRYTFTPDQALQDAATYVRCDLLDFDTFEPVTGLTPPPSRLGGTAYWDDTTVRPTESNGTGELYYDGPPDTWSYSVGNTGGGNSCSALSFAAVSLRAQGCCAPCGDSSGGTDSGRTVQEVCVIANSAPDVVMQWTRVIEDGGATIYYLDQTGARYDDTLPAGHQIVACDTEPQPCHDSTTVLLCDAPASDTVTVTPTVSDSTVAAVGQSQFVDLATPYTTLWSGGSLAFPVGAGPDQEYKAATGKFTADMTGCEDATGTLTVSVRVKQNGPGTGQAWDGALRVFNGTTLLAAADAATYAPPGYQKTLTVSVPVTAADIAAGSISAAVILETFHLSAKSWTADQFTASLELTGCTAAVPVQFLRTVVTDCETGEIVSHHDTTLDGADYFATGEVQQCQPVSEQPPTCTDCDTLVLCDIPTTAPAVITGNTASGTLPNGVAWTATNPGPVNAGGVFPPNTVAADGTTWWGLPTFPNATNAPTKWSFSVPSTVEFSVYLHYSATNPALNTAQLPVGLEVVHLPPGYRYDADTGVLTRVSDDDPAEPCSYVTNPQAATSATFRTPGAVTSFTTAPSANPRVALCGKFFTYLVGAITVVPGGQFLRHICRACDGSVAYVTDTLLDGTTPYLVAGTVAACQPPQPEPCCQPVPVCVATTVTEIVEFVSNEQQRDDGTVDDVWKWSPTGPDDPAAVWYDMYRKSYGAAWVTVDSPTLADGSPNTRQAFWVAPHPSAHTAQTVPPLTNEGPTLNAQPWWARASFDLPASADPDSIKVEITVLNADQQAVRFRLNSGNWVDGGADYQHGPYTFGPGTLDGAQPGTNTLYFQVQETLPNGTSNGAGVMAHLIATYEIPQLGQQAWTQMVCCDDSVYYLDETGTRRDTLPDGRRIVPCATPNTVVLCDDNGPFLRHVAYQGEQTVTADTTTAGETYTPVGTVTACGGESGSDLPLVECGFDPSTAEGQLTTGFTDMAEATTRAGFTQTPVPAVGLTEFHAGLSAAFGGTFTIPSWTTTANCSSTTSANAWEAVKLPAITPPDCHDGTVTVRVTFQVGRLAGSSATSATWLETRLSSLSGGYTQRAYLSSDQTPPLLPATREFTIEATVPVAVAEAGDLYWDLITEIRQNGCKGYEVTATAEYAFGTDGCQTPPTEAVLVKLCEPVTSGGGTPASSRQLVERCGCDDPDGDGIGEVRYVELWSVDPEGLGAPLLVGTYEDGDFTLPYVPVSPVDCPGDGGTAAAPPVLTGLVRVTDANPRNLSTDFPGLQSATLTVLAGNVDVAASSFGATVPAGASLTWSALDGDSGPLAGWSCTGQAGADYLLSWTYTA